MTTVLGNMVWPAMYVSEEFWNFWFLVFGTILIEIFIIKIFLKYSWTKSIISSTVGNLVSGFVGTFVMIWAMIAWHAVVDNFVPHATFDIINWVATYLLMCAGSVLLETLTIKIIYKEKIKRLFVPLLTGNLLTYIFIAYSMATATGKHPDEVSAEKIMYVPNHTHFTLKDSSNTIDLDTAFLRVSYNKNGEIINETEGLGYHLVVKYQLMQSDSFDFHFRLVDDGWWGGTTATGKSFPVDSVENEFILLFEQRIMDSLAGYRKLQPTDTIKLVKLKIVKD